MSRFAMFAKVTATAGRRDELLEILIQASRVPMPGCEMYVVNTAPQEPNVVCVYEVWQSHADHDTSLSIPSVKALVAKAKPLVANFEGTKLDPVAGLGLVEN